MFNRRFAKAAAFAVPAAILVLLGGTAYACTTFIGKVTVTGNGGTGTSTSIGYNEFNSTDGMYYCSTTNTKTRHTTGGAKGAATSPTATVTVVPAGSGVCTGGTHATSTNAFPNAGTYNVNYVHRISSVAPFSCTGTDCTFNPNIDCMSPLLPGGPVNVSTIQIDSSGYSLVGAVGSARGSRTYSLTRGTGADATGVASGICVSDTSATYANEVPIQML